MKAYDNYIFDLYGTLVDIHTEENDPLVWKKLALFYGYYDADYSSEELKERYAAIIAGEEYKMKSEKKDDAHEAHPEVQIEEVFQKLFEEKGVKADPTLAVHAGQFFRILSTDYVKLYDGVTDLLEALKKKGKKIYLLSNAQRIFTEYEMHTLGIAKYFDDIFISSTCGVKKPDSRFFQLLIDKYNLDITKSVMIGNDGISDIAGAKSVGLDTFYIHSNISPKDDKKPDSTYYLPAMDMKKVKELGRIAPAHCFQCLKHCNPGTTPYCITQALINAAKGKIDDALLFCGAYAYQATHLETVKEVIDSLIPERV